MVHLDTAMDVKINKIGANYTDAYMHAIDWCKLH